MSFASPWLRRVAPRSETVLLAVALLWTLAAKPLGAGGLGAAGSAATVLRAGLPDVAFFAAIAGLFLLSYLWAPGKLAARVTLAAAFLVLLWSMLNAAWLIATGIQLQAAVLGVLARDPVEFWPVVQAHLSGNRKPKRPIPSATSMTHAATICGTRSCTAAQISQAVTPRMAAGMKTRNRMPLRPFWGFSRIIPRT